METIAVPYFHKHPLLLVPAGLVAGAFLGGLARVWMRWISTDLEFSWSGTLFIIGAFAIFVTAQSIVLVLRERIHGEKATTIVRCLGALFSLQIFFGGAGALAPTVFLGSAAIYRKELSRNTRLILLFLSLPGFASVAAEIASNFGWTFATFGRVLLLVVIYGLAMLATFPTVLAYADSNSEPKDMGRSRRIIFIVGLILISLLFLLMTRGLPRN